MKRLTVYLFVIALCLSALAQVVTIKKPHFYSVYDVSLQCPRQVGWTITQMDLGEASRNPAWRFLNDVPHPLANGDHDDFVKSDYDRGHMCPAGDRSSDLRAMRSTFTLSNIAPQMPSLNRGAWKKTESFCRSSALLYDTVQVVALPIFLDRDTTFIGRHRLAVPHAFVKVAWLPVNDSIIGLWWFWNK